MKEENSTNKQDLDSNQSDLDEIRLIDTGQLKLLIDEAGNQLQELSGWLTNLALASLGFFLTTLIQIHLRVGIDRSEKILIFGAIFYLFIALLIGILNRFFSYVEGILNPLNKLPEELSIWFAKQESILGLSEEEIQKHINDFYLFRKTRKNKSSLLNTNKKLFLAYIQGAFLTLGITYVIAYLIRFLFDVSLEWIIIIKFILDSVLLIPIILWFLISDFPNIWNKIQKQVAINMGQNSD